MPFQKGHNLGKGRPKGSKNAMTKEIFNDLLSAMKTVKENETISKGKDILIHFIERSYKNDTVLCALMKKLVADQQATKVDLEDSKEVIVIGHDAKDKLTERIDAIARRREDEMVNWSEEKWIDYIKKIQSRKERGEVKE